jgi:hypothetical protein
MSRADRGQNEADRAATSTSCARSSRWQGRRELTQPSAEPRSRARSSTPPRTRPGMRRAIRARAVVKRQIASGGARRSRWVIAPRRRRLSHFDQERGRPSVRSSRKSCSDFISFSADCRRTPNASSPSAVSTIKIPIRTGSSSSTSNRHSSVLCVMPQRT